MPHVNGYKIFTFLIYWNICCHLFFVFELIIFQFQGTFDSSSYSSDSYNQYSSNPNDKNRGDVYNSSSGINNRSPHDPYRYARSMSQPPAKPMNVDRGRVPPPNKFR